MHVIKVERPISWIFWRWDENRNTFWDLTTFTYLSRILATLAHNELVPILKGHSLFFPMNFSKIVIHVRFQGYIFLRRFFEMIDFQIKFVFRIYSYKLYAPIYWPRGLISVKVISNIVYRINFKRCEGKFKQQWFWKFSVKI